MLKTLQAEFLNSFFKDQPLSIANGPQGSAHPELNIYQEILLARLQSTLENVFPVIKHIVGENLFPHLTHLFVKQYPSRESNIFHYGKEFYDFIYFNQFEKTYAFLPDLARLEWAWYRVFHGSMNHYIEKPSLFDYIQKQQESARLSLPDDAELLHLQYSVYPLWTQIHHQLNLDSQQINFQTIEKKSEYLMIWQTFHGIKFERLSQDEYLLLKILNKGLTLDEVCYHYQTFTTTEQVNDLFISLCQRTCIKAASKESSWRLP